MWLFTTIGFFSIVQKPGTDHLTVRARVADDLDQLRQKYLPELSPTTKRGGTDYPCRATVSHAAFAGAVAQIIRDIDYANYKSEVAARQGQRRAHAYHAVWSAVYKLERD